MKRTIFLPLLIATGIAMIFFYKTFLFGHVPFPGDILIAEYKPWRVYSFLGYNPGSYPNKAQYPDVVRQLYPWKTQVTQSLREGRLPLWNPYNFSGMPLLANFQSAVFYPVALLYLIVPQPIAWSILVILQPLLASLFTYWYCRQIKLSKLSSWLSAISFSYGSYMTVWLEYNTIGHVMLWLPLALLSIEKLKDHLRWQWIAAFVVSLTLPLLAGHPQLAGYVILFSLFYLWVRIPRRRAVKLTCIAIVFPIGIAAGQLFAGIELIVNAARSSHSYEFLTQKILIQPWQLLMLVSPDFFGNPATRTYWLADTYIGKVLSIGLVPLFFLLATKRSKNSLKRTFLITAFIVLLLTTVNPIALILYRLNIPVLSTSSPTLMIFLFQFSLAILCGIGLDWWRQEPHTIGKLTRRSLLVIGMLVFCFVSIFALQKTGFSWAPKLSQGYKALIYASAISISTLILFAIAIFRRRFMTLAVIALLAIHVADLFYSFHKFNPFVQKELMYPPTDVVRFIQNNAGINRIWGYGTAAIEANLATQLQLYSPDGYDPLYPRWYGEFIGLTNNGKLVENFTASNRSDASITTGFGQSDLMDNHNRLLLLERLGVKYILDREENKSNALTFPPDRFTKVYGADGWNIFELKTAVPRVVLVSQYTLAKTKEEFLSRYFNPAFDPNHEVILEKTPLTLPSPDVGGDIVAVKTYTPNTISLSVRTLSPKLLVLSDTYYPGWRATIDGKSTPIYKANYTMRSLSVPAGNHIVVFSYEPRVFSLGLWMSGVTLVAFVLTCAWVYKRGG